MKKEGLTEVERNNGYKIRKKQGRRKNKEERTNERKPNERKGKSKGWKKLIRKERRLGSKEKIRGLRKMRHTLSDQKYPGTYSKQ
jgi:hypothetical protein